MTRPRLFLDVAHQHELNQANQLTPFYYTEPDAIINGQRSNASYTAYTVAVMLKGLHEQAEAIPGSSGAYVSEVELDENGVPVNYLVIDQAT